MTPNEFVRLAVTGDKDQPIHGLPRCATCLWWLRFPDEEGVQPAGECGNNRVHKTFGNGGPTSPDFGCTEHQNAPQSE